VLRTGKSVAISVTPQDRLDTFGLTRTMDRATAIRSSCVPPWSRHSLQKGTQRGSRCVAPAHLGSNSHSRHPPTIPPPPQVIEWRDQPEGWRLRGATLTLIGATRESVALRCVVRQDRIERECCDLERLRRILIANAALVGNDLKARHRLGVRVAAYYQRVGALERTVEAMLRETENIKPQ
jgi:hypothetical protein